jgi:hypothetical protein
MLHEAAVAAHAAVLPYRVGNVGSDMVVTSPCKDAGRVKDGVRCGRLNSASLYKRSTIHPQTGRPRLRAFGVRGRSASGTDCRIARCC